MKKVITLFVLSLFCEVHCCEYTERSDGILCFDERYVKLVKEKTPGFASKCDIEVSRSITCDVARCLPRYRVNGVSGISYLKYSWTIFLRKAMRFAQEAGIKSFSPLTDGDVAQEPLRDARLYCIDYARNHCKGAGYLLQGFLHLGCFAYCGDVEALKILADMCYFYSCNWELAGRVYGAALNIEGITWEDGKCIELNKGLVP
jgi:hypothetical protein